MTAEPSDFELIEQFKASASKEAFSRLVSRHFSWVLSSARRQVRDDAMAEDVAQAAFIVLARKPPTLRPESTLSPWLFGVVRRTCLTALRAQTRRRRHEHKAATMTSEVIEPDDASSAWKELAPHLDALLQTLGSVDRQVLLLRFFEHKSLAEVGRAIGVSEDASRKRVDRALEKLRAAASKRNLRLATAGAVGTLLLANATQPANAQLTTTVTANAIAALSPTAAPTAASLLAQSVAKSLLWSSLKIPLALSSLLLLILFGWTAGGFMRQSQTPIAPEHSTQISAFRPPTTKPADGKLRVGYIVSKFTVTGPGKSFNGGGYTHAHPKVVPALADPSVEMWAVLEPGSEEDPSIAQIVQDVFGGRQLNGGDPEQLRTCDVIVAAGIRNATPEVLRALEYAVNEGTGLLAWICIGVNKPGVADPIVQKLNGLSNSPDHGGRFDLEWIDGQVIGTHEILGNLSGRVGTPVKFRPELVWGLDPGAAPLVQLQTELKNWPPFYPLYVSTLGKGRIVHFGFATYTQIPKDFDKMVGGHFALRCLNWLAHRPMPPVVSTTLPATQPVIMGGRPTTVPISGSRVWAPTTSAVQRESDRS
jgi:RNA polymerase sigma factor (sigma-70 family)